ncbi:MAG: MBL fold metallo-hydrolase, partial [Terriglobia bacterium]
MELVVLGSSAAYPGAGAACSGYLVREGDTSILLDIGTGVFANLQRWMDPASLSGLVMTHLHPDHFLDVYPLRQFVQINGHRRRRLPILAPSGASERLDSLVAGEGGPQFGELFDFVDIGDGATETVGAIDVEFSEVPHFEVTFGVVVGDGVLAYSSDCRDESSVVDLAAGKKHLLCEAAACDEHSLGHLTPGQAGRIAKAAGVSTLYLTHLWPFQDKDGARREAETVFDGEV